MPRKRIPILTDDPYFITARTPNRKWFELPMEVVWSIMEDYLYLVKHEFDLEIHAFVLMANHFHLLVSAPPGNLSPALRYLMCESSREMNRLSGRINQNWGNRNYKTWIPTEIAFMNAYKYLYRNPVRAGVCKLVEEYPFSTLTGLCGIRHLLIPVRKDRLLFAESLEQETLTWLNREPDPELDEEMRLAIRRYKLEFKTCRKTGRESRLQHSRL